MAACVIVCYNTNSERPGQGRPERPGQGRPGRPGQGRPEGPGQGRPGNFPFDCELPLVLGILETNNNTIT